MTDSTLCATTRRHLRWQAQRLSSAEEVVEAPDYVELCAEWDGVMSPVRHGSHDLTARELEAVHDLDGALAEIRKRHRQQSLEQMVTRSAWPLVEAAAARLLEVVASARS